MSKEVPVSTFGSTVHTTDLFRFGTPQDDLTGSRVIVDWFEHDIEVVDDDLTLGKEELRARLVALARFMNEHCHIAFRDHRPEVVLDFPVPYGVFHYEGKSSGKTVMCDVILLQKVVKERYTTSWESIRNSVTDFKGGWHAAMRAHREAIKAFEEAKVRKVRARKPKGSLKEQ